MAGKVQAPQEWDDELDELARDAIELAKLRTPADIPPPKNLA